MVKGVSLLKGTGDAAPEISQGDLHRRKRIQNSPVFYKEVERRLVYGTVHTEASGRVRQMRVSCQTTSHSAKVSGCVPSSPLSPVWWRGRARPSHSTSHSGGRSLVGTGGGEVA